MKEGKINSYLERCKKELKDLKSKYDKLDNFLESIQFDSLDDYIKCQMIDQHFSMLNYYWALRNIIEYEEKKGEEDE